MAKIENLPENPKAKEFTNDLFAHAKNFGYNCYYYRDGRKEQPEEIAETRRAFQESKQDLLFNFHTGTYDLVHQDGDSLVVEAIFKTLAAAQSHQRGEKADGMTFVCAKCKIRKSISEQIPRKQGATEAGICTECNLIVMRDAKKDQ